MSPSESSFPDVCQFLPCKPLGVHSPFLWPVGALSLLIPMVCLHNSGKLLHGTLFQSQCASWFSQPHHSGSDSNEDEISLSEDLRLVIANEEVALKLIKDSGSGLAKWLFGGKNGILWGWMGWFGGNYIYTDRSLTFTVGPLWLSCWQVHTLPAIHSCGAVLAGSDTTFWDKVNSCKFCSLAFGTNSLSWFLIGDMI